MSPQYQQQQPPKRFYKINQCKLRAYRPPQSASIQHRSHHAHTSSSNLIWCTTTTQEKRMQFIAIISLCCAPVVLPCRTVEVPFYLVPEQSDSSLLHTRRKLHILCQDSTVSRRICYNCRAKDKKWKGATRFGSENCNFIMLNRWMSTVHLIYFVHRNSSLLCLSVCVPRRPTACFCGAQYSGYVYRWLYPASPIHWRSKHIN